MLAFGRRNRESTNVVLLDIFQLHLLFGDV